MKNLRKRFSAKRCAVLCAATLTIMFCTEAFALYFCQKDTPLFDFLMGIVLLCPLVFTFFLQGVWNED